MDSPVVRVAQQAPGHAEPHAALAYAKANKI
jgi:hypothetical protein